MLSRMSSRQIAEWIAFFNLEPWGSAMDDLRAGRVAEVIANMNRSRGSKPFTPADFFPNLKPPQTIEDAEKLLNRLAGK